MASDIERDDAAPARGLRARLHRLLERNGYTIAAADQLSLSLFNFVLNIVLLRLLAPAQFGVVSLWSAVSQLSIGVQNAAIGMPLSVHVPATSDEAAGRRLEDALGTINLGLVLLSVAAVVAVNGLTDAEWTPPTFAVAIAIPLFIATNLYREFYRSAAFGRRDMLMLILIDGPYLAVTAACLVVMLVWPERFGGLFEAFLALSAGCVVSQLCLSRRLARRPLHLFRRGWTQTYRSILGEVWWSLVGVIATFVVGRCYIYLATALAGLTALAAINAVGILFRPVSVLMTAWGRLALPHLAEAWARADTGAFRRDLLRALGVALAGSIAWAVVLWLAWSVIERTLLAGKYPEGYRLLLPWALCSTLAVQEYIVGIALNAAREFRFLAYTQMLGGVVAMSATAGLILAGGYTWTMYGVAIGDAFCLALEVVQLTLLWRAAARPRPAGFGLGAPARSNGP